MALVNNVTYCHKHKLTVNSGFRPKFRRSPKKLPLKSSINCVNTTLSYFHCVNIKLSTCTLALKNVITQLTLLIISIRDLTSTKGKY